MTKRTLAELLTTKDLGNPVFIWKRNENWLYLVISGYIWLYLVIISKLLSGDDVQNLPKKKELNTSEYIRDSCHLKMAAMSGHPAMTAMIKHASPA
jgi:hypothetical protein